MAVGKYQPLTLTPINFSLTEGTAIPAPPDSPPETPRPPTPGKGPLDSHPTPTEGTFPDGTAKPKESTNGSAENSTSLSPTSPTGKRPGSVRKFLGFHSMASSDSLRSDRPGSPDTVDSKQTLSRKKSGSWFGKRKSTFVIGSVPEGKENQTPQSNGARTIEKPPPPEKKGPPPPALPALSSFGVSEETTSLGADDMFKNIK